MTDTKQIIKRTVCAFMAVFMTLTCLASGTAFAERTKWSYTEKASTNSKYSSLVGSEYYEARTPSNERNTLYVKGKTQSDVKMLRIALYNIGNKTNYLNVFVRPDSNGCFEVKINTAAGNTATPTAKSGKVMGKADKALDSRPGNRAVQTMPKGFYLLRIAVARTTADANVYNGAEWHKGTLGGEHGFVWRNAMFYVSGDNNPRLIEFTDIIERAEKTQATGSIFNARYTDVYLKDMSFVLKDSNFQSKPMNTERVAYIKTVAKIITMGASTDAEKLAMIYEYVAKNFYYDHYAYDLYNTTGINIQCVNPYDNLYNQRNKIASTNSTSDGKVATVCDGYSAMVVALCRSLDIPSRIVYGCNNDTSDGLTSHVDTTKKNHWWAEVYIDSKWVIVDAERGSLNSWNRDELSTTGKDERYRNDEYKSSQYWDYQGWTATGLDMSHAARATHFLMTGVQDSTGGKPYVEGVYASTDALSGKPKITWTEMSGCECYNIYRGQKESDIKYYASSKTNAFVDSSAEVGQTYHYRVTPVTSVEGAKSNMVSVKCASPSNSSDTPERPDLKITTSAGRPQIYWEPSRGAVKYWIYRSTDGEEFAYYDTTTNTSYTNKSTSIGTTYYYRVKAVDINGKSSRESAAKGILCKPAVPSLSIYRSDGKPKLSWKAVTGADKYWVYRSTDGKNFSYWDSTTKLSYTNTGAASGVKYYYRVKAVAVVNGKNVASANSGTKSLLTTLAKPSVSITTSGGKPKLSWKAVTGADKYWVYRSTDGKNFSYWDSTTKLSYTNSGAEKNTKYYYKVRAVCSSNNNANSAQSTTVSIKATK